MTKKIQNAECVRVYGKYTKNRQTAWWVMEKNSNKKHIARDIFEVARLIQKYTE